MKEGNEPIPAPKSLHEKITRFRERMSEHPLGNVIMLKMIPEFAQILKERYPDWDDRQAYHDLIGSTVDKEDRPNLIEEDFPGDDSVETFFTDILGEE